MLEIPAQVQVTFAKNRPEPCPTNVKSVESALGGGLGGSRSVKSGMAEIFVMWFRGHIWLAALGLQQSLRRAPGWMPVGVTHDKEYDAPIGWAHRR